MRPTKCLILLLVLCTVGVLVSAGRRGGGGRIGGSSSRRGGSVFSRPKTPAPAPRTPAPHRNDNVNSNNQFLNNERGASTGGTTHNRNPFAPSAPQPQPQPGPVNTNGPIGFEKINGQHNSGSASHTPSAPNHPAAPPPYNPGNTHSSNTGSYSGANDHPPPYPGRPVNAPPSYSSNNPYNPQANPPAPGFNTHTQPNPPPIGFNTHTQSNPAPPGYNTHPQSNSPTGFNNYQQNNYQGQHFPQQNYPNPNGNHYGNSYPHQNQYGSAPSFSPYPSNANSFSAFGGSSHGGTYPHTTYQGNAYGGTPFGNGGNYNGNPYYNTNNFGYSNNPGYFGGGYQGGYHPGQYEKKSRFGGLPIPIPIPIPIPLGGFGGFGGFGSGSGSSYHHGLLDTFVRGKSADKASADNKTSIFILNNSTVTPCTTDHFVYDHLKISVVSCTAENCTAVKVFTTTKSQSVHSAGLTVCLENNATSSHFGDNIALTVSEIKNEIFEVCRNVTTNSTDTTKPNSTEVTTAKVDVASPENITTTEATTTVAVETHKTSINVTKVCETVECHAVELCFPFVEIVDSCTTADCPFRRTGYKPCVNVKLCRSPTTPVSAFASLNTTISKIDEFNNHQSVYDFANLTLISYHRPVITFDSNCTQNSTAPGCAPATPSPSTTAAPAPAALTLAPGCSPTNSTGSQGHLCTSTTTTMTLSENSTEAVTTTEAITTTS